MGCHIAIIPHGFIDDPWPTHLSVNVWQSFVTESKFLLFVSLFSQKKHVFRICSVHFKGWKSFNVHCKCGHGKIVLCWCFNCVLLMFQLCVVDGHGKCGHVNCLFIVCCWFNCFNCCFNCWHCCCSIVSIVNWMLSRTFFWCSYWQCCLARFFVIFLVLLLVLVLALVLILNVLFGRGVAPFDF